MKKFIYFLIPFLLVSCEQNGYFGDAEQNEVEKDVMSSEQPQLIFLKSGAAVEKKGDQYIWGGDMVLSPKQLELLDETGDIFGDMPAQVDSDLSIHPVYDTIPSVQTRAMGIYPTSYNIWLDIVPFTYGSTLNSNQRTAILNALNHIEAQTNVRFYNATGQSLVNFSYIEFVLAPSQNDVSDSYVGHIGGKQEIRLLSNVPTSTVTHEICHSLGMLHEQQRYDRDSYVTINTSNLTAKGLSAFQKRTTNYSTLSSYDFNSIMGYSSFTISQSMVHNIDSPMYTKINGDHITAGTVLSNLDREWLNTFYLPFIARNSYLELAATVYKPDNTVMTSQERLALQSSLNNGNPNPPPNGHIFNDLSRSVNIAISGDDVICVGSSKIYSTNHINGNYTWDKSSNLNLSGSGSSVIVTGVSNGSGWVSLKWNGIEVAKRNVWVGPPTQLTVFCPFTYVKAGFSVSFTANNVAATSSIVWSVYPNTGVSLHPYADVCQVYFSAAAANTTFTVTATVSNPCGSKVSSSNIDVGPYAGEGGAIDAR